MNGQQIDKDKHLVNMKEISRRSDKMVIQPTLTPLSSGKEICLYSSSLRSIQEYLSYLLINEF